MRTKRAAFAVSLAVAVLLVAPVAEGADGARPQARGSRGEYVVTYASGQLRQARAAIEAAEGTIVSVVGAVRMALVSSTNPAFLREVRASAAIRGASRNHSIGTTRPGMPHRFAVERPTRAMRESAGPPVGATAKPKKKDAEPLADLQWDMAMIGATPDGAWKKATGKGVLVGIIDTGIDATHPDLAPNFSASLSRNFTMDIPSIDGPCEYSTCIDPANVDHGGHGTHVAGSAAAARNGVGIAGVAPDATLVNVRAGQDSGYFFLYETVAALVYAGDAKLDVANMSFYTDPWLYNCDSPDDYLSGTFTPEELEEQQQVRQLVSAAMEYAHDHGVALMNSAGNSHFDLSLHERPDSTSPDYPPGSARPRVVTDDCLDLPSEGPHGTQVSALGPSGAKADYSNYGFGEIDVSAPGGWFRDGFGTPTFRTPYNEILSSYPLALAIEEGLADPNGNPLDAFGVKSCNEQGTTCGFYYYLQGTSMASPHAAGVAALIVQQHGKGNKNKGFDLDPNTVGSILRNTATDHACPPGGFEDYTQEGRTPDWNAVCEGDASYNGLYGHGVVSATGAVR